MFANFPSVVATMVCPDCSNRFLREEIIVSVNLPTDDLVFLTDLMEDFYFTPSHCNFRAFNYRNSSTSYSTAKTKKTS